MFHQVETFQTQDSWTLDTLREAIRIYKESGAGGGADSGGFGKKIEKQLEYQKKRIYDECSQYNELCNDFYGTNKSRVMSETEKGRITARTQTCGQAQSYGRNQSYGQNQSYGPPNPMARTRDLRRVSPGVRTRVPHRTGPMSRDKRLGRNSAVPKTRNQ